MDVTDFLIKIFLGGGAIIGVVIVISKFLGNKKSAEEIIKNLDNVQKDAEEKKRNELEKASTNSIIDDHLGTGITRREIQHGKDTGRDLARKILSGLFGNSGIRKDKRDSTE
jgi:hypothetical protein